MTVLSSAYNILDINAFSMLLYPLVGLYTSGVSQPLSIIATKRNTPLTIFIGPETFCIKPLTELHTAIQKLLTKSLGGSLMRFLRFIVNTIRVLVNISYKEIELIMQHGNSKNVAFNYPVLMDHFMGFHHLFK